MSKRVTLTVGVDRGHGPFNVTQAFLDANVALAWLNGFLGEDSLGENGTTITRFTAILHDE